jgi:phosphatidylserine decarboxylase
MIQLAKEGYPFIIFFAVASVLAFLLRLNIAALIALILTLFMIYFFRDPDRLTPHAPESFYSPADGKIIKIEEATEDEILKESALKISIFMSPLNVHVNRAPCEGTVLDVKHFPGKFFSAFKDDASKYNEHITMMLDCTRHGRIVLKQIAGSLARRAVCRVKPGDRLRQGERYGMIKFSSRVDIFLPLDTDVRVKLHDKVRAGETVLGVRVMS